MAGRGRPERVHPHARVIKMAPPEGGAIVVAVTRLDDADGRTFALIKVFEPITD
ncbi:MAG: hypothetical protein JWL82_312 [Parcubacteria group bacterium]|nr:hypothetical protein [Parcubacteria group bacterium]